MMREYQVRICERLGVQFPGPTRQQLYRAAVEPGVYAVAVELDFVQPRRLPAPVDQLRELRCDPFARSMGWWAEDPIENADDLQPALKRAVAQVKKGMPALVDMVTQHR
jgi:hypothetical protein